MAKRQIWCTWYNDEFLRAEIADIFANHQKFKVHRFAGRDPNIWNDIGNGAWQKRKVQPGAAKPKIAITY